LYCSANTVRMIKSRRLRWAGHVARRGEGRSSFKILTGKPIEKKLSGRPRRGWGDNIRIGIKEIDIYTKNWADLTQDRDYWITLVIVALSRRVP